MSVSVRVDFAWVLTTASGAIRQPSTISTAASTVHPRPRERRLDAFVVGDSRWRASPPGRVVCCSLPPAVPPAQFGLLVHLHI